MSLLGVINKHKFGHNLTNEEGIDTEADSFVEQHLLMTMKPSALSNCSSRLSTKRFSSQQLFTDISAVVMIFKNTVK